MKLQYMESTQRYLELLKEVLTGLTTINEEKYASFEMSGGMSNIFMNVNKFLTPLKIEIVHKKTADVNERVNGIDWPQNGFTMVGMKRLNNLQDCLEKIIDGNIEGDILEAGVWRGGASIFMKAVLETHDVKRKLWLLDSFQGFQKPDEKTKQLDKNYNLHKHSFLSVSLEDVKNNFVKFNLLDDNVEFVKGWVEETAKKLAITKLALLRLDVDAYLPTAEALKVLYPKVSKGGFVVIDDYGAFASCRQAVDEYRQQNSITDPMVWIDQFGMYWVKS